MSYSGISDRIIEELNKAITDPEEIELIIDLLKQEKLYANRNESDKTFKKQFQLLVDQHSPQMIKHD